MKKTNADTDYIIGRTDADTNYIIERTDADTDYIIERTNADTNYIIERTDADTDYIIWNNTRKHTGHWEQLSAIIKQLSDIINYTDFVN